MMEQIITKKNNVSGLLYAEDFSVNPVEKEKNISVETVLFHQEGNLLSEDDIAEAYQRGLREGGRLEKELWNEEKKQLLLEYNQKTLHVIENIQSDVAINRDGMSRRISSIFFRTLINIFPEILKRYEDEEIKKTIDKISQFINNKCDMELTCSQEFCKNIEGFISNISWNGVNINVDDSFVGGDFKISWNQGFFSRNVNEIISKMEAEIFSLSHEEECKNVWQK